MKKLLSLLASVSMVATAGMAVVACGTSDNDKKDMTASIIKNSKLGEVTTTGVLQDLKNKGNLSAIFGDEGTAMKTYMNYAAQAFMAHADELKAKSDDYIKNDTDAASYIDDSIWESIKTDYKNKKDAAKKAWTKAIDDAKDKYGDKKWESEWLKDLQNQFGESIFLNKTDDKKTKSTSYTQYKDLYINYTILNGASGGQSLADSLKDDILTWAKAPNGQDIESAKSNIKAYIFKADELSIGGKDITFKDKKTLANGSVAADTNNETWFSSMKDLLDGLNKAITDKGGADKLDGSAKTALGYLINMINITGGYNMEDQVGDKNDTANREKFLISNVKWASVKNVASHLNGDNTTLAQQLVQRWDANYDNDFGATPVGEKTDVTNLDINGNYDVTSEISTLYNEDSKNTTSSSAINGLFSNAQRFLANDYYQVEKPVAVSELVVKPLYSTNVPDMGQFITNKAFVGGDANGDTGLMDNLYKFLGNFITDQVTKLDGSNDFTKATTTLEKTLGGTSQYSWDELMTTGLANLKDTASLKPFSSAFTGNVSFTSHSNLLTRDSSSSDYSDLLKYSVYDFLQSGAIDNNKLAFSSTAAKTADTNNMDQETFDKSISSGFKANADTEFNVITNFVNDLNRTKENKSIYKVVNEKQGIIAFIDKDGIHFVRVEGYGLLAKKDSLLQAQTPLNVAGLSSENDDEFNATQSAYHSGQLLASGLAGTEASFANEISSDYYTEDNPDKTIPDTLTYAQQMAGVRYSDLNKGFGNKYLQFLANSSIPTSNGYQGTKKYSYNLNDLLKTYSSGDYASVRNTTNMLSFIWNYVSKITGMDVKALMNFVATEGGTTSLSHSLLFDALRNTDVNPEDPINDGKKVPDENTPTFASLYTGYISSAIASDGFNGRQSLSRDNFAKGMQKLDDTLADGTTWDLKDDASMKLHPSKTFNDDLTNSAWYTDYSSKLDLDKAWSPSKAKEASFIANSYTFKERVETFKYETRITNFVFDGYALKGDEE